MLIHISNIFYPRLLTEDIILKKKINKNKKQ